MASNLNGFNMKLLGAIRLIDSVSLDPRLHFDRRETDACEDARSHVRRIVTCQHSSYSCFVIVDWR
jgi:hypothetical protein